MTTKSIDQGALLPFHANCWVWRRIGFLQPDGTEQWSEIVSYENGLIAPTQARKLLVQQFESQSRRLELTEDGWLTYDIHHPGSKHCAEFTHRVLLRYENHPCSLDEVAS